MTDRCMHYTLFYRRANFKAPARFCSTRSIVIRKSSRGRPIVRIFWILHIHFYPRTPPSYATDIWVILKRKHNI